MEPFHSALSHFWEYRAFKSTVREDGAWTATDGAGTMREGRGGTGGGRLCAGGWTATDCDGLGGGGID